MKKKAFVMTMLLMMTCIGWAQKVVQCIDVEYDTPIPYVEIANEKKIIGKANIDGVIRIKPQEGKLIFSHEAYERVETTYDNLKEIVYLRRRTYELEEVEVRANQKQRLDQAILADPQKKVDKELSSIESTNGNLLAPLNKWLHNRKTRKQRKLEKLEETLSTFDQPD